jgi:hypothetical protein
MNATWQEVTLTRGSQEKHVLQGDVQVVRNDFDSNFVQTDVITMPAQVPSDRGSIVAWVVPEGKTAVLKHPTHQPVTFKPGLYFSVIQVEFNEFEGITDAWD